VEVFADQAAGTALDDECVARFGGRLSGILSHPLEDIRDAMLEWAAASLSVLWIEDFWIC
jgi:hypothetical protein